jgi:hypothetical protein
MALIKCILEAIGLQISHSFILNQSSAGAVVANNIKTTLARITFLIGGLLHDYLGKHVTGILGSEWHAANGRAQDVQQRGFVWGQTRRWMVPLKNRLSGSVKNLQVGWLRGFNLRQCATHPA